MSSLAPNGREPAAYLCLQAPAPDPANPARGTGSPAAHDEVLFEFTYSPDEFGALDYALHSHQRRDSRLAALFEFAAIVIAIAALGLLPGQPHLLIVIATALLSGVLVLRLWALRMLYTPRAYGACPPLPGHDDRFVLQVSTYGLSWVAPQRPFRIPWTEIIEYRETREAMVLVRRRKPAIALPKRFLVGGSRLADFRHALEQHLDLTQL